MYRSNSGIVSNPDLAAAAGDADADADVDDDDVDYRYGDIQILY